VLESADATCPLAVTLARRLREASDELTGRWLERIVQRVAIDPNRVFPTDELLDHVPLLLAGIAEYIEDPARAVHADSAVMAKAMELGALRHAQGFDAYEVLKEYEILGGILFAFLTSIVNDVDEPCSRAELFVCAHRVFHAVALIQQATTMQFLQRMTERLHERDERLRAFNRTLAHEFRNRIGAAAGAAQLIETMELGADDRAPWPAWWGATWTGCASCSSSSSSCRAWRGRGLAPAAARAPAARRRRERAHAARPGARQRVEVRLDGLPDVEVPAAAVELCLSNLVSKRRQVLRPGQARALGGGDRRARRRAPPRGARRRRARAGNGDADSGAVPSLATGPVLVVRVRDNGLGIPRAQRPGLFGASSAPTSTAPRTSRARASASRSCARRSGPSAAVVWAEFPDDGVTVFALALPARREGER
jgi:signal transduction histidine kinase